MKVLNLKEKNRATIVVEEEISNDGIYCVLDGTPFDEDGVCAHGHCVGVACSK